MSFGYHCGWDPGFTSHQHVAHVLSALKSQGRLWRTSLQLQVNTRGRTPSRGVQGRSWTQGGLHPEQVEVLHWAASVAGGKVFIWSRRQAWAGSTRGRSSQRGRSNWIHSSSRSSSRNLRSLRSPRRPRSQIRSRRTRSSCPRSLRNPSHSHSRNRSRNRSSRSRTAGSSTLHSSLALQHSRRSSPLGSTPWSPPVRSQVRTATRAPQV